MKKFLMALTVLVCSIEGQANIDSTLNLMPVPASVKLNASLFVLDKTFAISVQGNPHNRVYGAATRFMRRLGAKTGIFFEQGFVNNNASTDAVCKIEVVRPGRVELHEDESYELLVTTEGVKISAETDLGAMHGLETLLQLLTVKDGGYVFEGVAIQDAPRFAWRGLMIDAARHFQPVDVIKRNLDVMSAMKMNVFHFHLSDDQGFRVESKIYPKLQEKASDGQYYTHEQIRDIVQYATDRGIRVMPELDVPGHATAILTAYPELGSADIARNLERNAGIFNPTLDPTNEEVYVFLNKLFEEWTSLFPDEYFHIGGDENEGKEWDANPAIQKFMKKNKLKTNHDLQTMFNIRLEKYLKAYGKKLMGWEEIMTPQMPTTAVIHAWRGEHEGQEEGESLREAAKRGFQAVLSNGYYIDRMHNVEKHYLVDPHTGSESLSDDQRALILGGEATMWSELVTPLTIDSRIWPRTAAIAERFWSPASVKDVDDMNRRLSVISHHLEAYGATHKTSRAVILRNIAGGGDTKALEVLINVAEPLKGYTRNPGGTMYKTYSPYSLFADATTTDAPDAKAYNKSVMDFLDGDVDELMEIEALLRVWALNHEALKPIIERSPAIKEIEKMSESLSELAILGLEAIEMSKRREIPTSIWITNFEQVLESASEQGGRTKLRMVESTGDLVTALLKVDLTLDQR